MRYLMQFVVMAGDLMLIVAAAVILYYLPFHPITWILIYFAYCTWRDSGGPIAWKSMEIRKCL